MDKKTAQRLLHRHLHNTQTVPWINESASQRAFPFSAAFVQFVLSEGTDRPTINNLCYSLTALLGQVAAHLRHVDLAHQSALTIKAIVQRSIDLLDLEHKNISVADTLAAALAEHLSDWSEDGASADLAALFGEALTVVAQTLSCVNNDDWKEPQRSLLEACEQAIEAPESDWELALLEVQTDETWGRALQEAAALVLNLKTLKQYAPEIHSKRWYKLKQAVESCLKQKCCRCYAPGSIRYSCGEYAGRYCDEHWETAGFRPADDRVSTPH